MNRSLFITDLPPRSDSGAGILSSPYAEPDWYEPPLAQRARIWNQLVRTRAFLPASPLRMDWRSADEIEDDGEDPGAVLRPFALPYSQWEPAPHRKIAHPYGVVALAMLVGSADSPGTGVFAPYSRTPALIRVSLAHPFLGHHPAQIGIAIKLFRWRTFPGHLFCNNPYRPLGGGDGDPRVRDRWAWSGGLHRGRQLKDALRCTFTSALPDPRSPCVRPDFAFPDALEEIAKGVTAFDIAVEALGSPSGVVSTRLSHRDICTRNVDTTYFDPVIPYAVEMKLSNPLPDDLDREPDADLRSVLTRATAAVQLNTGWDGDTFASVSLRGRRDHAPTAAGELRLQSPFISSVDGDRRLRFPHPQQPDPPEVLDRAAGCPAFLHAVPACAAAPAPPAKPRSS
jgi:hypothetical protein